MRVGKGLMTIAAEMTAHGYDPAILFDPRWHDAATEFVRAYVMRSYEHGWRFELRNMVRLETAVASSTRRFRFQRRLPDLQGKGPKKGPDAFLHHGGLAYPIQLKAYKELAALFGGAVTYTRKKVKGKPKSQWPITKVEGPEIPRQVVMDLLRLFHWDFKVPGADLVYDLAGKPASYAGWDDLAPVSICVIDDVHLVNVLMAGVSLALEGNGGRLLADGRRVLDLAAIGVDTRPHVRTLLGDAVEVVNGDEVLVVDDADALWEMAQGAIRGHLTGLEDEINDYLGHVDVIATLNGRVQRVMLFADTEGPEAIVTRLGLP
jgi:hypothetical protein